MAQGGAAAAGGHSVRPLLVLAAAGGLAMLWGCGAGICLGLIKGMRTVSSVFAVRTPALCLVPVTGATAMPLPVTFPTAEPAVIVTGEGPHLIFT